MPVGDHKGLRSEETLQRVAQFYFSRDLLRRNYEELVTFVDYFCARDVAFSYSPVNDKWLQHEGFREVSRLLHNFVAAAHSLVDHSRVIYRQLYEPAGVLCDYPTVVRTRFADDPLAQFVHKLRQMAQHYRLPSLTKSTSIRAGRGGIVGEVNIELRLRVQDLRQFDGWSPPARIFLAGVGEEIQFRPIVAGYYQQVTAFHQWYQHEQERIHGEGLRIYMRSLMHGVAPRPREEVQKLSDGIARLEKKPKNEVTFGDLEAAFRPVLCILDTRRLMLCRHDAALWTETALNAAHTRFEIPEQLCRRVRELVAPELPGALDNGDGQDESNGV